ncbi:MAG: DnaD domain-containing protein [Merdibacter sp.]
MSNEISWNAPYFDRRTWLLSELASLNVTAEEALTLLLIDYFNGLGQLITHDMIAAKLHCDSEQVDCLPPERKGLSKIDLKEGRLVFDISGTYASTSIEQSVQTVSLFDEFETEFARPLSSAEMQRLSAWMDTYDQQMILYALYEAGVYDKRSLDYIERILVEWKRRGLTPQEYEEGKR